LAESKSKKSILEFKHFTELRALEFSKLPNLLLHVSQDVFEFDLIVDHYKSGFSKQGVPFEFVIYVSEPGDQDKLFSELFNFSMFSSWKLIIVKSGADFFKPILTSGKKDFYEGFKRNIANLSDQIYLVIQYDSKELPAKLGNLFNNKYAVLKTRNYYNEERKRALEEVLRSEKVTMDIDAMEEFMHQTPPNSGSYIKNIQKLKYILGKKHFTLEDLHTVLYPNNEFNPFNLVDVIFQNKKFEFYKEFSKIREHEDSQAHLLSFLSAFLNRADEVRKAGIVLRANNTEDGEKELFKILKMDSYSEGRKKFIKSRLRKEIHLFTPQVLDYVYEMAIDLNIKAKSSPIKDDKNLYFLQKMERLFGMISNS
jgi:DNA polymerase-3 subunit delta